MTRSEMLRPIAFGLLFFSCISGAEKSTQVSEEETVCSPFQAVEGIDQLAGNLLVPEAENPSQEENSASPFYFRLQYLRGEENPPSEQDIRSYCRTLFDKAAALMADDSVLEYFDLNMPAPPLPDNEASDQGSEERIANRLVFTCLYEESERSYENKKVVEYLSQFPAKIRDVKNHPFVPSGLNENVKNAFLYLGLLDEMYKYAATGRSIVSKYAYYIVEADEPKNFYYTGGAAAKVYTRKTILSYRKQLSFHKTTFDRLATLIQYNSSNKAIKLTEQIAEAYKILSCFVESIEKLYKDDHYVDIVTHNHVRCLKFAEVIFGTYNKILELVLSSDSSIDDCLEVERLFSIIACNGAKVMNLLANKRPTKLIGKLDEVWSKLPRPEIETMENICFEVDYFIFFTDGIAALRSFSRHVARTTVWSKQLEEEIGVDKVVIVKHDIFKKINNLELIVHDLFAERRLREKGRELARMDYRNNLRP